MEDLNLKKCTICLDDIITDIEFLPCTHAFHKDCISGWITTKPLCPICQIPIFVNSPQQLAMYNRYKNIRDRNAEQESRFFHQVSAGVYDNNPNNTTEDNQVQPIAAIPSDLSEILTTIAGPGNRLVVRRIPPTVESSILQLSNINNILDIFDIIINNSNMISESNAEPNAESNAEPNAEPTDDIIHTDNEE